MSDRRKYQHSKNDARELNHKSDSLARQPDGNPPINLNATKTKPTIELKGQVREERL
jgi:hypothetical protein